MHYNNWFSNFEPALHTRDKSYLVVMYNYFMHCWGCLTNFVEEIWLCAHKRSWFVPVSSNVCLVGIKCWPHRQRRQWHPHSSTLAWKIPWMEEPGRLQSMGSLRVRHDWATSLSLFTFHFPALEKEMATHSSVLAWRIPGTGILVGCRLWGRTESDTTKVTQQQAS